MEEALAYVVSLYGALLIPFRTPDFGPKLATALLALALLVILIFLGVAVPHSIRLRAALSTIRGRSKDETEIEKRTTFQTNYDVIDAALLSNKTISTVWQEFRKALHRDQQHGTILASARPNNFFHPRSLLVQYDFVRTLPNYFVGLGLLGTFIGLIAALTFATQSLTRAVDPTQIKAALNDLLTTAAAKFYISAAGLVASLVLSLLIKLTLKHLHSGVHEINDALQERLLFKSEQNISEKQLSIQQQSLTELKLFNTNIAMKIGDAVRTAVEASNDNLTKKLSEIADSFARLIDASGEGAGKAVGDAMKGAFDTSLRQAGEAIAGIAVQLKELPGHLSEAAASIRDAGGAAARQQEQLSASIQEAVKAILNDAGNQIADNIGNGTRDVMQGLQDTGSAFGESAAKIGAFFERFSGSGEDYMKTLASLSEQNTKLESGLSAISSQITTAADSVARASTTVDSNLGKLLTGIADVSRLAAETGRTVQQSQEAVHGMIETLQKQMSLHIERFNSVDEKLATVFNSIGSHLELQSKQMGEQLTTMDQALSRAVNQFEQLVEDLSDAMSAREPAE
jgi:hypothetical protein